MFDDVWWYLYKYEATERYKRTAYLFNIHISLIQSIIKIVFEPDCFWYIVFLERPILSLPPSSQPPATTHCLIENILLRLTRRANLSYFISSWSYHQSSPHTSSSNSSEPEFQVLHNSPISSVTCLALLWSVTKEKQVLLPGGPKTGQSTGQWEIFSIYLGGLFVYPRLQVKSLQSLTTSLSTSSQIPPALMTLYDQNNLLSERELTKNLYEIKL